MGSLLSRLASRNYRFRCNVCGAENELPRAQIARESAECATCRNYARLRAMAWAVMRRFAPRATHLLGAPADKRIRGLGCSDALTFASAMERVFDYQNTFFDREPRLDLTAVDLARWPAASFDFITSSDVLEHIAPPVERALVGMRELLKPGGVAVLTVPTSLAPYTIEHFPELHEWHLHGDGAARILVNHLPDGREQRFDNLCFHGGEGMTLEFRLFSRSGLLRALEDAGFVIADVFDDAIRAHGIPLQMHDVVVVAERPRLPRRRAPATMGR